MTVQSVRSVINATAKTPISATANNLLPTLQISPDGFVFDTATGATFTLNRSGRFVLQKLQQRETQSQIASALTAEFGITASIAMRDVADFWQQMTVLGLLTGSLNSETQQRQTSSQRLN